MNPYAINPPESEVVFERLCLELLRRHWSRRGLERFAKKGEEQFGVDIFDTLAESPRYAAQCKLKEQWKSLEPGEIHSEIDKAKKFPSKLDHYAILTTGKISSGAQLAIQAINQQNRAAGLFTVELLTWEKIADLLRQYPEVERQFYGGLRSEEVATVTAALADTPAAVLQAISEHSEKEKSTAAAGLIVIPRLKWQPGLSPPAALLRADIEVAVPFHSRQRDLDELMAWIAGTDPIKVRLVTGAGGIGKTRLLIETCNRLAGDGWQAGFLDNRAYSIGEGPFPALVSSGNLLVVIDYAETRREEVRMLLRTAFTCEAETLLRVVLLARSGGDWWDALRTERDGVGDILSGPSTSWAPLRAFASSVDERRRSLRIALEHFARRLGRGSTYAEPEDLESEIYSGALILHMKALAQVEGVPVKGEVGILDYILRRERHFWEMRAQSSGLSGHLLRGISQAMTVVTLSFGIDTQKDALELLRRIRRLHDQPESIIAAISDLLHEMYPGNGWIAPLLPDLLGEHLVSTELSEEREEILALVLGPASR